MAYKQQEFISQFLRLEGDLQIQGLLKACFLVKRELSSCRHTAEGKSASLRFVTWALTFISEGSTLMSQLHFFSQTQSPNTFVLELGAQ